MAEEGQVLSIQQRIAALNQGQIGRNPNGESPFLRPKPAPSVVRNKTMNNPPCNVNGSILDNSSIGNEPRAGNLRQAPLPPPFTRADQRPNGIEKPVPPPLPSRKSTQQPPTLPPRRPSAPVRRGSLESTASDASSLSVATSAGTGRTTGASSTSTESNRIRAPAWGETELPPLPPKREEAAKNARPAPRLKHNFVKSYESLPRVQLPSTKAPPLPKLPPRRGSSNEPKDVTRAAPRPPPRIPSRDPLQRTGSSTDEVGVNVPDRKLPPPPPSAAAVDKIRQSGFGGLNKSVEASEKAIPNGVPPPVPLASRPDLSKIQATKPRLYASTASGIAPNTVCLKCRDYSGPDTHAARFPRESLASHNLAWLAQELTAPFPSLTDKARALFTWLHHNISYDVYAFFNDCLKPSTPESTLASGLAVCEGYAALFANLAAHAGLEALVVSGHGKGFGHEQLAPGSSLPPFEGNHAWNVVKIDNGYWKLIDTCWGAGHVQGAGMPYVRQFDPSKFTDTNDEFGLSHYPANKDQFYRDDGRPGISWEEYMLGSGSQKPKIFSGAKKYDIGEYTYLPATPRISVYQSGPIRFQFRLVCEHWTLAHHSRQLPGFFLLVVHGIDGRKDEYIPFNHVQGSGSGGGGDVWYVDVSDPRVLGAPGQKVSLVVLTSFGDRKDGRGLTLQEYRDKIGRVGMGWEGVAEWELV